MLVPLTISDFLDRAALVHPERTALVDEPGVPGGFGAMSYGELAARAAGMAAALDDLGVPEGGRVGIVSPNAGRFLVAFFGVSGYGRVLVPINFRLNAAEVAYIVEHSGTDVLLVDPEYDETLAEVSARVRVVLDGHDDVSLFAPIAGRTPKGWGPDENAICSINYTSGTTARPKGVELTHRNCTLNAMSFGWHTGVTDRDVLLHTLPMFHCNGWGMPYAATGMGARHVVLRKVDGEEILRRVDLEGVTLMCGAPAVVAAVLTAAEARARQGRPIPGRATGADVRIVVAGAPPPSSVIQRVETDLAWEFIQIYGLTETAPLLTINRAPLEWDGLAPAERARLLSRAGVPAIGVRMDVDEEGEVLARSNHVFSGYWRQPEESERVLTDGWFHTGDGGHLDGAFVVISDRKKDVIISGGENVSSIEVEDALYGHPSVAEAAVIGVPDDRWGETVKALVVLRPESQVSEADLIAFCRSRLAHFKCPTSIEFYDSLPRTATGKLQRFKLRQPYWEGKDRQVN
ncbi:MAG TPA: AMP-binding protein [Acidimicrobiales bacterium]|nr:AMP-binding protein [Acidimicrobiales bacterium]